ncbi:PREDICTED: larval cuticle protein A2B-like [Rhagoletis zephyria]|uniref:larval cuticle protein A2B-like n=1 Tax=Rhagoletis zephyria TaxID=28612 RepID=UPI00081161F6|nr:PREDICTED: larval cuticle protein A2B-like [Rhagoletis zephyria]
MAFKFAFVLAFVAIANAGYAPIAPIYHTAPAAVAVHAAPIAVAQKVIVKSEEYDHHPQYKFSYAVDDKLTGDSKTQVEERDGDVVRGEYSLIDSDGYKRTVQYTSDPVNGFNAVVNREPFVKAVAVAPVIKTVTPVVHYAAPALVKTVAPVAHYTSPVAHYAAQDVVKSPHYTAPVSHYAAPVSHYAAPVSHYAEPALVKYQH